MLLLECVRAGVRAHAFSGCTGLTSLALPDNVNSVGERAFYRCVKLSFLTLPNALTAIKRDAFGGCSGLVSIVFRPPVSRDAFVAWAVGSSRHRANWQLTTVKHSRNVLRLITALALERRDVSSVDPDGSKGVFNGCPVLGGSVSDSGSGTDGSGSESGSGSGGSGSESGSASGSESGSETDY